MARISILVTFRKSPLHPINRISLSTSLWTALPHFPHAIIRLDPVADFIANSFLTTNTHRLITMHGQDVLSFYIAGSGNYAVASFKFNCIARKPDGSIGQYEYVSGRRFGYGVTSVAISATEQQAVCQSQFGAGTQLLSFTLTFNNRVCHFYLVPCPDAKIFRFKNIFGCEEAVAFPATTIAHLETDYSEAMVGGKLLHYDVKHARSYEVQTASLLAHHMVGAISYVL